MNIGTALTYTGIALVFLSTLGYSIRVGLDPAAASLPFTLTFCGFNLIGWVAGSYWLRRRGETPMVIALQLLGDVLFPLSVFAVLIQYVPWSRAHAASAAWTDIALGLLFHAAGYWGLMRSRFPRFFYPYFFAAAPTALIYLLHGTNGVAPDALAWGVLLFGVAFALFTEARPALGHHFKTSAALVLLAACAGAFFGPGTRGVTHLALAAIATALLWRMAVRESGSVKGAYAAATYLGLTCFFTLGLLALGASNATLLCFTAGWVCLLTVQGMVFRRMGPEAFGAGAQWVSIMLACALAWYTSPIWLPLAGPWIARKAASPAAALGLAKSQAILAPIALAVVSLALWASAFWNRRYPTIAQSLAGFLGNQAVLGSFSYLSPILLLMATGAGWAVLRGPGPGVFWTEFAVAVLFLTVMSKGLARVFPSDALDFAGTAGLFLAGLNALAYPALSGWIFAASALLLAWRAAGHPRIWLHLASIAGLVMSGVATSLVAGDTFRWAPIAAASVAVAALWRTLPAGAAAKSRVSLLASIVLALVAGICGASRGDFSPAPYLVLWGGLLVAMLSGNGADAPRTRVEGWLVRALYTVALCAGGGVAIAFMRGLGASHLLDGVTLAICAWLHLAAWRGIADRVPGTALAHGTLGAAHGLGILAIVFAPWAPKGTLAPVACAASYAGLWFQMGLRAPSWRPAALVGYALGYLTLGLCAFSGANAAIAGMAGLALFYLQRSATIGSGRAHLLFLLASLGAALVACLRPGADAGYLPLATLAIALVLASRWVRQLEGQNTRVFATMMWGVVVGAAAIVLESFAGGKHIAVYATVWAGMILMLSWWDRRRVAVPIAFEDRRAAGGHELLSTHFTADVDGARAWGYWIAHLGGLGVLISVVRAVGIKPHDLPPLIAGWAWLHLGLRAALQHGHRHGLFTRVTGQALHAFAAAALVLAMLDWKVGLASAGVAGAIALFYLTWRAIERSVWLEHLAGVAATAAVAIAGVTFHIRPLDWYFAPVGAYLAIHMIARHRRDPLRREAHRPIELGVARVGWADLLPLVVLLLNVVHPFVELSRDPAPLHLFLLGLNSIVLLHMLLVTRQQPVFVYAGCLLFILGAVVFTTFGQKTPTTDLFLVLAGALGLANLAFVQDPRATAAGRGGR